MPQDAFGQELLAYHHTGEGHGFIERDDGMLEVSDTAAYFSLYQSWSPAIKTALRLAHGRVLDIGCGAGRHALHLESRGHDVLGIDSSPGALQVCKQRGVKAKLVSIRDLDAGVGAFDTIIMFGNNFGLFGN